MKTAFVVVCGAAALVLSWRIGYDNGLNTASNFCPAVQQGERLAWSTQTLHGTECTYITHTNGKAKRHRKTV